jgi:HEAT repeat protein
MRDPQRLVRYRAARALGQMGAAAAAHPGLLETLRQAMSDPDEYVRSAAAEALERLTYRQARVFEVATDDRRSTVRWRFVDLLALSET